MASATTLTAGELIWLVRGLSFMLGGLLTALAGAVVTQLPTALVWSGRLLLLVPSGAGMIVYGAACLSRLASPVPRLKAAAQRCLWLAVALLFLSPFAYFWYRAPWRDYLTVNVLLLLVCAVWLLLAANRLVLRWGAAFRDDTLVWMARIGHWLCCLLVVFPSAAFLSALAVSCWHHQQPFLSTASHLIGRLDSWVEALALAPACLTASLLWTLKAAALALFQDPPKPPPGQPQ
jgi:hypothetical protein